jgi:hypothetical protein
MQSGPVPPATAVLSPARRPTVGTKVRLLVVNMEIYRDNLIIQPNITFPPLLC